MGRSDTAAAIAADLNEKDLEALACEVWELWVKDGAQSKTKWVLSFTAVFGGAAMTPKLVHAINDWPQNARGAIACDAVAALTVSPDPAALVAVDGIARKFKFRQVKAAAAAALERAAQELGITAEELADRIVPTLGFAANGTRVFDYGPRKFTVRLTPSLELMVTTEAGKAVKSMPAPGKTDDGEKAPTAYEAYKALKKQIKTTIAAQRARLEMALSVQRCWDSAAWRKLFVENPVMHQFAISLIWGVYENGGLNETFRYMEDGSFNTVDEEEYTLPDGASIGLIHPVELEEDILSAWKQQLEDYEITQNIDQLSRPVYRLPAERAQDTALETVAGRILNSLSLTGKLQSMGWYRGSVLDGGGFYSFYREDPSAGMGMELNFSGSFVGGRQRGCHRLRRRLLSGGYCGTGQLLLCHGPGGTYRPPGAGADALLQRGGLAAGAGHRLQHSGRPKLEGNEGLICATHLCRQGGAEAQRSGNGLKKGQENKTANCAKPQLYWAARLS